MTEFKKRVVDFVRQIPKGRLVNFGLVSKYAGGTAQSVGWIMSGLTLEECEQIPWYRVVAKDGYISAMKLGDKGRVQRMLLEEEGFEVIEDKVDIKTFLWEPDEHNEHFSSSLL